MSFISGREVVDIVIAVVAAGYIFMDAFSPRSRLEHQPFGKRLLFSVMIAAPAIVLHEFGHKFVAMALGYTATFHAAYMWLALGVVLKLIQFPFLFVVPAYVSISGPSGIHHAIIAFAGPIINALIWLGAWIALKSKRKWSNTTLGVLYYTRTINGFLFILNMLPIPGFDGYWIVTNLF
jgi:Zn-dependent protease